MTIISEALLAIGTILVAVAFVFVGGNIINFQSEGLFSSTQNQLSQEVSGVVNGLPDSGGSFSTTYEPSISSYSLTVQEHRTVVAEVPGQESSSTTFLDYYLENTRISDADQICVSKTGSQINFSEGSCSSGGLSNFCTDGRCVNDICQPDRGETCSNSEGDCMCPGDAESDEASGVCDTDYEAESFIDADTSGEDTTELGCVKEDYVDVQETGERCSQDFECSADLSCNEPHYSASGVSGSRCCPEGSSWNGSACQEDDKIKLVFVPLNENTGSFDTAADQQSEFFIDQYPIDDPSKVEVEKVESVCNVPAEGAACSNSEMISTLPEIEQCAQNAGYNDFTFAIGIYQNNVCGSTAGWSDGSGGTRAVVAEAGHEEVTAHEIGHEYGLNDEYLDACRYGGSVGGLVSPENSNCLQESYDGDKGYDTASDRNTGTISEDADFCAGGSASPLDINPSNYPNIESRYTIWCMGNQNSNGGRDIMSYAGATGPREFAEPAENHLEGIEELQ